MLIRFIKYIFNISILLKLILIVLTVTCDFYLIGILTTKILNFVILISALLILLYKIGTKSERTALTFITIPIITILILINSFITIFFIENQEYIFNSPNNKNSIILDENTFLSTTYYQLYEKKAFIFKKKLPQYISTDNQRPFYDTNDHNNYSINWKSENKVIVSCKYFHNIQHFDKITVNLN